MKNLKKKTLVKRLLAESLEELLEKNKLKDITVQDICNTAEISRATFYRNFNDKFELVNWIFSEFIKDYVLTKKNFYDQTVESLIFLKEKRNFFKKVFAYTGQNSFLQFYFSSFKEYFEDQILNQNIELTEDLNYMIIYNTSGCTYIIIKWLNENCPVPPKQLTEIIIDNLSANLKEILLPKNWQKH